MPMYEYRCSNCGKVFEQLQKFSDEPLTAHPECGGGPVEKLISAPAFQFKGTGWYVTDYAKGNSGAPASGEGSKGGDSGSKSEPSTAPAAEKPSTTPAASTTSSSSNTSSSSSDKS